MQKGLYPTLARMGISFGPIKRLVMALLAMATGMAYAAGVQALIYSRGPCYSSPLVCPGAQDSGGQQQKLPNDIVVWVQVPTYVIMAFAEILGFTTLSEYSYSKAPKHMRTVIQAARQFTSGLAFAMGMALSPVSKDPEVIWMYTGLAAVLGITGVVFWVCMGHYDEKDDELNTVALGNHDNA
ncbi:hypothetical protein PG988_015108 [Apiospora saccharicola]